MEFRQTDDPTGQGGPKQTVAFITPAGGTAARSGLSKGTLADPSTDGNADESGTSPRLQPPPTIPQPVFDPKLVDDFLSGEHCLNGVRFHSSR